MSMVKKVKNMAAIDIFELEKDKNQFVGQPFYLDYEKANLLVCDKWKKKVGGIPQGTFLLAFYINEEDVEEALLLRVLRPSKLPTESDIISSMVEYYKDSVPTDKNNNKIDDFTRYEFSFSGVECRVLGTFYRKDSPNLHSSIVFGADVENFFSAHNYSVYKVHGKFLEFVVNIKENGGIVGSDSDIQIGEVRYSSSKRQQIQSNVPVYISPQDFLGKRTALFGMTRTGKSNTVKKIIESTQRISEKADAVLGESRKSHEDNFIDGKPVYQVGQIIFDVNGEYANPNLQDEGTAIYELYRERVHRYSVVEKEGFEVLKVNFYTEVSNGYELIKFALSEENVDYVKNFCSNDFSVPDASDRSAVVRAKRRTAAYLCCLHKAGFDVPAGFKLYFDGHTDLNGLIQDGKIVDPKRGLSIQQACLWFEKIWEIYDEHDFFADYKRNKGKEWADDELKSILVFLTRRKKPGGNPNVSGFIKLRSVNDLHTSKGQDPFEASILSALRNGDIVIVDLSQGNPFVQRLYSEKICKYIFANAMGHFINNHSNNFIQFYFEEAHNLFPKKDDKDLSQIYNRIAKEGAKLNLGLLYATQEVSSISSNILKNTQNWFIAHLNNEDEIKELKKYYDFRDFTDSLIRFSSETDKGFVRMKTYSNPFVVPVQIDKFSAGDKNGVL